MDQNRLSPATRLLAELYVNLEGEIAALGFKCAGCGKCCHFDEIGHTLFASDLEIDYLLQNTGRVTLPETAGRCPFQENEKCNAREYRPLGCRLYFCRGRNGVTLGREDKERLDKLSGEFHDRLKDLHRDLGIPWHYQPFLKSLAEKLPG